MHPIMEARNTMIVLQQGWIKVLKEFARISKVKPSAPKSSRITSLALK